MNRKDNRGRNLKNGESQRSDGQYQYRYTNQNGERRIVYSWRLVPSDKVVLGKKYGLSLREKEEQIGKDLSDGINMNGANVAFNVVADLYFNTKKSLASSTMNNYRQIYNKHIRDSIGIQSINKIRKVNILNLYSLLADRGLSNGTINLIHNNIIFPVVEFAVDNDLIRRNISKNCIKEYPYDSFGLREALTKTEQQFFLNFVREDKVYSKYLDIINVILLTGLRRGEVIGLTWDEVDLKNKILKIRHQVQYMNVDGKFQLVLCAPKTKAGYREIQMTEEAYEYFKKLKDKTYFKNLSMNINLEGHNDFVFLNSRGTNLIIPRQFSDSLMGACKKYNSHVDATSILLPDITAHILRHTACTRMAESGIDPKVLQIIMGHKKYETTMNIYNHVDKKRISKEMQKLEGLMV